MRSSGKTYNEIAEVISVPKNTVKTYCNRHNIKVGSEPCEISYCKHCGAVIKQNGKNKSRSFCSDDCRYAYWNEKRKGSVNKVKYKLICGCCGKEFETVANKQQKYCCHNCYVKARFRGGVLCES